MPKIKVKRFKQENAHRQTEGHTRTQTDATKRIISPAIYAVDKNRASDFLAKSLEIESIHIAFNFYISPYIADSAIR